MNDKILFEDLENDIKKAYEESVTIEDAEKLAAKFLGAQIEVTRQLKSVDLDRRMRKRGLKSLKSAVRLEEIKKHEKKPTEGYLDDVVNMNELISEEEDAFDSSDVNKEELERYFSIFHEAHIYFRGISKGRFDG